MLSPSSSPPPLLRRRRTTRDLTKQPPRKGDLDYIKRPENAFMLFRKQKCEEHRIAQEDTGPKKKFRQADLSKVISHQWKTLPLEEKRYWNALAQAKKAWHEAMYPNYVYRPGPRKNRNAERNNRSKSEEIGIQLIPFPSPPPHLNDTKDYSPTHTSNYTGYNAFGTKLPPRSQADNLLTNSSLRSPADQTLTTSDLETVVRIRHPSCDPFFAQPFARDPATLNDPGFEQAGDNFLCTEQIFRDADMNDSLFHAFVASIPETTTVLQENSPSGSITPAALPILGSDTFDLPLMDWNETTMRFSPSTSHEVPPQGGMSGDIDAVDFSELPRGWCTNLAGLIHEEFDWHPVPSPA